MQVGLCMPQEVSLLAGLRYKRQFFHQPNLENDTGMLTILPSERRSCNEVLGMTFCLDASDDLTDETRCTFSCWSLGSSRSADRGMIKEVGILRSPIRRVPSGYEKQTGTIYVPPTSTMGHNGQRGFWADMINPQPVSWLSSEIRVKK